MHLDEYEVWALQRAEQIVLSEGMKLMEAAQCLDRKQTIKASQQLRSAICKGIVDALVRDMRAQAGSVNGDHEIESRTAVLDEAVSAPNTAAPTFLRLSNPAAAIQ